MYVNIPLRVLSVSNRVTNDILKEDLEDTTRLLVDETRDTFDTTTAGKTTDSLLIDTRYAMRLSQGSRATERTGLVIPWMLSRKILRWRLAPPFPRPCQQWRKTSQFILVRYLLHLERRDTPCHPFRVQTCLLGFVGSLTKNREYDVCWRTSAACERKRRWWLRKK